MEESFEGLELKPLSDQDTKSLVQEWLEKIAQKNETDTEQRLKQQGKGVLRNPNPIENEQDHC